MLFLAFNMTLAPESSAQAIKGYDAIPTGLVPQYPFDSVCPALTSLYGSMTDVDGSKREKPHTGVDGGRFGDVVIAPADGKIIAVWETNHGWGPEWSVLISHTSRDLNLSENDVLFLSEFDHLERKDVAHLRKDNRIKRGQTLGKVRHPGGNPEFPAETHWEVYEVPLSAENNSSWIKNKHGGDIWVNQSARLIDPLYMLSRNQRKNSRGRVDLTPFTKGNDYSAFRGFTYIFECQGPPSNNGD